MKKTLLFPLTFLFLFFFTVSFAQSAFEDIAAIPDSLKSKTNNELNQIIRTHIFKTHTHTAAKLYVDVLLTRALADNNHLEEARSYNYYYRILSNTGALTEALVQISKAIAVAEANNYEVDILKILYRNKGIAYFRLGDYEDALRFYVKELELTDDYYSKLQISHNIGLIKLNMGDKKDALKRFKYNNKAYDSLIAIGQDQVLNSKIINLMGLGKAYTSFQKLDSSLYVYQEGYNFSKDNAIRHSAFFSGGIGNVYSLQKKYNEAIPYLDISERLSDSLMILDLTPYIHLHKGRVYNGLKQYPKAIHYLKKVDSAMAVDHNKASIVELQECYALLANSYYALNDYKNATENYEKFIAIDKENDGKKTDIINTIYERYDLKVLETQIENLSNETIHQNERLSATKIIISILCIVILVLFLIFQYRSRSNKRKFNALVNKLHQYKDKEQSAVPSIKPTKKVDRKKLISEEKAEELLKKLQKLEAQKAFLHSNFTIAWLAKKMNTNATYVSIIINDYKQKKFPEYVSELRIDYATKRLKDDPKFRLFTIRSISKEVGYKSPEAFSTAFKKINGIYPSYFIKMLNS